MGRKRADRIAVLGIYHWTGTVETLLRRGGLNALRVDVRNELRWKALKPLFSSEFRGAKLAHIVWGGRLGVTLLMRLLGKRVIWHWIGTDVVEYGRRSGWAKRVARWLTPRLVAGHLADSPELAAELAELNVDARVCRLLPESIEAEVTPLPDRFRVLGYWFDNRLEFYGGDKMLEVADRMPDVEFWVVGAKGEGVAERKNVRFLGRISNMTEVYRDISVYVRMPEHDSLSVIVLEALARGRYVVYNKPFPHCQAADTADQLHAVLGKLRSQSKPNEDGAKYVRERFSPQHEAEAAAQFYHEHFGDRFNLAPATDAGSRAS